MGEFLKRCESVRMKCRATEEDARLNFGKKRKVYSKLEDESCGEAELAENSVSPATSRTSSCSKHDDSSDVVKKSPSSPDLENADSESEGFETEISTLTGRIFSREATPTSELYGDSEHVLSTSKRKSTPPPTTLRRKNPKPAAENMPSPAELEAFFAAAEKYEHKRFAEKYNYDIVKDVPLAGKYHWRNVSAQSPSEERKAKGIVVVSAWVSISDVQLKDFVAFYTSLGWSCLVSRADYLNPFIPERATSLAFSILEELVKELRRGICPVVLASFSGGSKACLYKVLQIIQGCSDVELCLEDSRMLANCISGQIYDSDPIEFTKELGARFALHRSILRMPGSSKLVSLVAKGVTSSLDALFITRFGSQRTEYWKSLYSSVGLGAPFLILCSENDDVAPCSTPCHFAHNLQDLGAYVKVVKCDSSIHVGHHKHGSVQYTAAVTEFLEQAVSVFSGKLQKLGEWSHMDDEISYLICDLQNAAVNSNQSFRRVAVGPNDHFFLPSSSEYQSSRESASTQQEQRDKLPQRSSPPCMSANSVLGQALFDACVPKNVEGWDIKFSGSLNGEPFASVRRRSPIRGIKHRSRL